MTSTLRTPRARGFTLIEVLVVTAIIGVLLSIILVAVSGVFRQTRNSSVQSTLTTMATAVDAFKADIGALPPLLSYEDNMWRIGESPQPAVADAGVIVPSSLPGPPGDRAVKALQRCRYASEYSFGVYLFGAGDLNRKEGDASSTPSVMGRNLGGNTDDDDGVAGPGIRAPGPDRSWGGAVDRTKHRANKIGRVFGPYLDASRFGDSLVVEQASGLYKVLDPWNQPVRYYWGWPVRDRTGSTERTSVLRVPVELRSEHALLADIDEGEPQMELEAEALNSQYALLSAGAPRFFNADGSPLPLWGYRREPPNENGPEIQDLTVDFMPELLPQTVRDEMLRSVQSNIRVTR